MGVRPLELLLFLSLLGGCAGLNGPDAIQLTELRRLEVCNSESGAAAVTLFKDAAELERWQARRGIDLLGAAALSPGPYAVIEHGVRNTGGYGIAPNRRASIFDGVLTMSASFMVPNSALRAQVLTSPCILLALPRGDYGVVDLLDPQGYLRASSNEPPPPAPKAASRAQ